jgi:hypothetical protein
MWYQDNEANFIISYPQTWIIKPAYRQGQTIFSSPETNSEVRIDTWPAPDNQNWLEWVRQDPHRFILTLAPESIVANATVLGQSAFFHFQPGTGGSGDMAIVLFQSGDLLFNIFYHSGTIPAHKAEVAIYRQMVSSFSRTNQTAASTILPTGWEEGSRLVVFREQVELKKTGNTVYQEISGTLTDFDPGRLVITADDGQNYHIGGVGTYFDGQNVDMYSFKTERFIDVGERLFFITQPLASEEFKAVYTAVEQDNVWQPSAYQSFFDLNRDTLPISLAAHFPANEPLHIWLRGAPAQLMPYLAENISENWANSMMTATNILAYGTLENMASPQLQVEKLYVLTQPCDVDSTAEICTAWQQQFPTVPPTVITATISSLLPENSGFLLSQPNDGFIAVRVSANSGLVNSTGQPLTWADVLPGMQIRAIGKPDLAGSLKAEQVVVIMGDG